MLLRCDWSRLSAPSKRSRCFAALGLLAGLGYSRSAINLDAYAVGRGRQEEAATVPLGRQLLAIVREGASGCHGPCRDFVTRGVAIHPDTYRGLSSVMHLKFPASTASFDSSQARVAAQHGMWPDALVRLRSRIDVRQLRHISSAEHCQTLDADLMHRCLHRLKLLYATVCMSKPTSCHRMGIRESCGCRNDRCPSCTEACGWDTLGAAFTVMQMVGSACSSTHPPPHLHGDGA